jgi:hypothetical protein
MTPPREMDAHIVLADISGYTAFLRDNQLTLRHASYIIAELLAAVLERAEPTLRPDKVEGDAVLFVAPVDSTGQADASVRRSLFAFFRAFDRRRAELVAANTCPCEACTTIDRLELKVIDHYGQVLRYKLGRFDELAGLDVIIAHRLLKNSLAAARYLLVTEAAWQRFEPDGSIRLRRRVEACEGVGDVPIVVIEDTADYGDDLPRPPPRRSLAGCMGDLLIKHLMLLPAGHRLVRRSLRDQVRE